MQVAQLEVEKSTNEAELEDALHRISLLEDGGNVSEVAAGVASTVEPGSVSSSLQMRQLQDKLRGVQEELFQAEAGTYADGGSHRFGHLFF